MSGSHLILRLIASWVFLCVVFPLGSVIGSVFGEDRHRPVMDEDDKIRRPVYFYTVTVMFLVGLGWIWAGGSS